VSPRLILALALGSAPLQCSRQLDPSLEQSETPPEALYRLASRFNAEHDVKAYRETLRYLSDRYPNSRFADRAKAELAEPTAPDGGRR
jgi:TolA-binding protein